MREPGQTRDETAPAGFRLRAETDTFVFDLDDTLYPRTAGLHELMRLRVVRFVQQLTGCSAQEASELHARYYRLYGTSLVGLVRHHGVKPMEFLSFVHDIELTSVERSAALAAALAALPGRRIVFTNGSARHAARILEHLGIAGLFEAVCDIEACRFVGKPERAAYETFLARHNVAPERAVMFEDRAVNLAVPHELGMQTVLVGAAAPGAPHVHFQAGDLAEALASLIAAAFPRPPKTIKKPSPSKGARTCTPA